MRDEHLVICSPTVFELITDGAAVVPVKVDLVYDTRDPFAVQASFRTGTGGVVDWVFARDLLHEGLTAAVGAGDVRVRPTTTDPNRVRLELSSPSGHAVFTTSAHALDDFLDQTYEAVPADAGYPWGDFDVALSDLLNDPACD